MIGGVKVIVIWTSSPLAGPSPLVTLFGALMMPFTTVFETMKVELTRLAPNASVFRLPSRVTASISISAGELARDGTCPEGGCTESLGNTRYNSTSTLVIFERGVRRGISPVIVA